jgi:hypothetical protein
VLARLERYELDVFADEAQFAESTPEVRAVAARAGGEGSTSTTISDTALEAAARRAGRRKAVAQASLFDLANEKVIARSPCDRSRQHHAGGS